MARKYTKKGILRLPVGPKNTQYVGDIYLFCFRNADGSKGKVAHAGHYLGWSGDLPARTLAHEVGRGACMTKAAKSNGLSLVLVRQWIGTRSDERTLKNRKNGPKLCPLCNPPKGKAPKLPIKDGSIYKNGPQRYQDDDDIPF